MKIASYTFIILLWFSIAVSVTYTYEKPEDYSVFYFFARGFYVGGPIFFTYGWVIAAITLGFALNARSSFRELLYYCIGLIIISCPYVNIFVNDNAGNIDQKKINTLGVLLAYFITFFLCLVIPRFKSRY